MGRVAPNKRGKGQLLRNASSFMRERKQAGVGASSHGAESLAVSTVSTKDPTSPNSASSNPTTSSSASAKVLFVATFITGWAAGMISSQCLFQNGSVFRNYSPCSTAIQESALDGSSTGGGLLSSILSSEGRPSLRSGSSSASSQQQQQQQPQQQQQGSSISKFKAEEIRRRNEFAQLVKASKSDKYERHHYEQYYARWFEPHRTQRDTRLLEIGAADGKSMKVWNQYFVGSDAKILGLAYGRFTQNLQQNTSSLQKVEVMYGDQSKMETMDSLSEQGPYDIIIDDGSHVPQHMVFSLFALWDKSIKPGGVYVLEDLETNYWTSNTQFNEYILNNTGIGVDAQYSAVAKLEQIQQVLIARRSINAPNLSVMPGDIDICSIEWGMNVVAIHKCDTGVNKPPFTHHDKGTDRKYDAKQLDEWIKHAKLSNPTVINGKSKPNSDP